ncbi:MAG: hypothetical protein WAQ99_14785 [Pyrinomonadaceae bacterium]
MASYGFYPEAAEEYLAATQYYHDHASELIAAAFVVEVEAVIERLRKAPAEWPIVEEPQIRRVLLTRFPYSIYIVTNQTRIASRSTRSCIQVTVLATGAIAWIENAQTQSRGESR